MGVEGFGFFERGDVDLGSELMVARGETGAAFAFGCLGTGAELGVGYPCLRWMVKIPVSARAAARKFAPASAAIRKVRRMLFR
jgi:hypothetical protein